MLFTRVLDLNKPPIIGNTYLTPCINMYIGKTKQYEFVPILGQPHVDPELNNDEWHGHLDVRFANDEEVSKYGRVDPNTIGNTKDNFRISIPIFSLHVQQPEIKEVPKLCVREGMDLRGYYNKNFGTIERYVPNVILHSVMEDQQENKKLDLKCKICPHRGVPLNSVTPTNGILTCPGHGLQWSISNGKLIRRTGSRAKHAIKVEV